MCGTGPSKQINEFGSGAFKEHGQDGRKPEPAPWRSQSRFDYYQQEELEGQRSHSTEEEDRDLNTDFYKNLSQSEKDTIKEYSEIKQNQLYLNNGSTGTMLVGADHYLKYNNILKDIPDLSLAENKFGVVRFETRPNKSSVRSPDILAVNLSTNVSIFPNGVEDKKKSVASGELFRDQEFPPEFKSLAGFGVDEKNQTLPGANKDM